jgi:hypothetical protein
MACSRTEVVALRRLARVYRRLLLLAVPAALAGCGDSDALAPESADGAAELSAPAAEALMASASLDRIAFMNMTDNGSDIWGMSPTGTNQKRMTSYAGDEDDPIWSPDHGRIAFVRQRGSHLDVYLMNADGSNGHWAMPKDPGYVVNAPSWAPDGKSLLAQIWVNGPYVGKIDLATGEWSHVAAVGHYGTSGRNPIYSKDGKWIYYLAPANRDLRKFQPGGQDVSVKLFTSAINALAPHLPT